MPIHFPPLNSEMQKHSAAVLDHIRNEIIKAGGHISLARFMEIVLYTPGLGYYSAGSHKLGKIGDFVTAPELSPLFAQSVARQFADLLPALPQSNILEIGAGAGTFAKDTLLELEQIQTLPKQYYILETSADLRERQQKLLEHACSHLFSRIVWLDRLPRNFCGIIFANEVLDALPVHSFRIENATIKERCIGWKNDQLVWQLTPPLTPELNQKASVLMNEYALPEGYESEINLFLPQWIKTLADLLEKGIIIFFDYGYGRHEYYHPSRSNGTLRCYFQHRCHNNPFLFPGLQDITTSVDFTTVAEAANQAELTLAGFTTQSSFLLACGVIELANAAPFSMKKYIQNQAIKMMMLPSEMGTLIKAIALTKDIDLSLRGFSLFDKRQTL